MKTYLDSFTQKAVEKYKELGIPLRYTLEEIDKILKTKYLAVEVDKKEFADLKEDPYAHYENIRKCYVIQDKKILERLFTDTEKIDLYNMIQFLKTSSNDIQNENEKMWKDVQEGGRINIILESEDNKYISDFTLQGMNGKIMTELYSYST
ncbi:MAG TPA: hypothetical protein VNM45_06220 [Bacillus sp. (in: firmicutes)]|nr:hypothetical protein [Bacillus sp. (in: firmicutes)]